jgi:CarD family transcriptional regulator
MRLTIGQKVAYPNQGVCLVEREEKRRVNGREQSVYFLRVLKDASLIMVPVEKAGTVGLRPLINRSECKRLLGTLAAKFEPASRDWKVRVRELTGKLQSGDIFAVADVFKKLALLSRERSLSFREQTMLERAKLLVVSEIASINSRKAEAVEMEVMGLVERACRKSAASSARSLTVNAH